MYTIAGAACTLECVHRVRGDEGCIQVLVGKPEGKIPLGRPRRRWIIILKWIFRKWDVGHGLD